MAQHTHARPQRERRHQPGHGPEELTALIGGREPHALPWHAKHECEPTAIDALACRVEHEERAGGASCEAKGIDLDGCLDGGIPS